MARLEIKTGPAAGQKWDLSGEKTIGRGTKVDFQLNDPALSRLHARFQETKPGHYIVEDLNSHNGTFLNRRRVNRQALRDGDVIQAGKTQFIFYQDEPDDAVSQAENTQLDLLGGDSTKLVDSIALDTSHDNTDGIKVGKDENTAATHEQLTMIMEFFQSIDIEMREEKLLSRVLDILFKAFPHTDRGFIVLRNPDTGKLVPAAAKGEVGGDTRRVSLSQAVLKQVIDNKQSVLTRDALHDGRFESSETVHDLQLRSVMCAPLKHEDEILGFISLDTHRVTPTYNKHSLGMLAALANFASLTIGNARMHRDLMAQERVKRDLRNAQRIQHSFLPQSPPDISGYRFADWYNAAHEVGGDFYDFIELPDGRMAVVIGDVSGKGITAALLMAKLTSNIRSSAAGGHSPDDIMSSVNQSLVNSTTERYATLIYMLLDPDNNTFEYINAGHWPPLVRQPNGEVIQLKKARRLPVGVRRGQNYKSATFHLSGDEQLCLYTDGVIDAMNEDKEPYGINRLIRTLNQSDSEPQSILENVQQSVWNYMGKAEQHDDTTVICFGPK